MPISLLGDELFSTSLNPTSRLIIHKAIDACVRYYYILRAGKVYAVTTVCLLYPRAREFDERPRGREGFRQ